MQSRPTKATQKGIAEEEWLYPMTISDTANGTINSRASFALAGSWPSSKRRAKYARAATCTTSAETSRGVE